MKIFVSGAAGYIGGAVCAELAQAGFQVQGGVRRPAVLPANVAQIITGDLANAAPALNGVEVVVHAAGLGHRRGVTAAAWRRANLDAAVNMARAAAAAGAQRFILLSTAYVLGRVHEGVVTDETTPRPMDVYATSKLAAERAVAAVLGDKVTVLRPAAVIGPGAPGNLKLLLALLRRGVPLPFGAIRNRRSFIDRGDLARLVLAVIAAEAPPPLLLAAHPAPIATPDLIRALAAGLGLRARLLPCPLWLLGAGAAALGRRAMWQSLAGDFAANPRAALALGWRPAASLPQQLCETARYDVTTGPKS